MNEGRPSAYVNLMTEARLIGVMSCIGINSLFMWEPEGFFDPSHSLRVCYQQSKDFG